MKKIPFGMALLAITFALISAFTAPKKTFGVVFYRKPGAPAQSHSASHYEYYPTGICATDNGKICKAEFTDATAPAQGVSPTGTFVQVIQDNGTRPAD